MLLRLPVGSGLSPDLVPKPLLWPEPGALDYAWRDPGQLYESGPGPAPDASAEMAESMRYGSECCAVVRKHATRPDIARDLAIPIFNASGRPCWLDGMRQHQLAENRSRGQDRVRSRDGRPRTGPGRLCIS